MGDIYYEGVRYSSGHDYTELTGTLLAGNTSVTLTDNSITNTATYDFYTESIEICPVGVIVDDINHQLTLSFDTAYSSDIAVKVRVS